jgi:hypothetical protein
MKCNAINATLALAVLGCVNLLTGCKAAPNATEPTQATLYRTSPVLLEPEQPAPMRIVLAAGDQIGFQLHEAYLARAEGHAAPIAEPVVVAQTAP